MARSMLPLLILCACGCDPEPAPPSPPSAPGGALPRPAPLPPAGTLRLERHEVSADPLESLKPAPGTPRLVLRMAYAGRRTWIVPGAEAWRDGRRVASNRGGQSLAPPVQGHAAFGFGTSEKDGRSLVTVLTSLTTHAREGAGGDKTTGSIGAASVFEMPAFAGRRVASWEPPWPMEIPEGQEAFIWGVFLDEPEGEPPAAPEVRAKRAPAAWLFSLRVTDRED